MKQVNWAGNLEYRAARWHCPETVAEAQELVARSRKVKVLGSRHSFNAIADTTGDMLDLSHFDQVVGLDRERHQVTVEAGIRYGTLCKFLHGEGYALHNLASLPHISVAGACATATHGSGNGNGNLATIVSGLELITADGEVKTFSREQDGETFAGMVVGLGALGMVTKLTLDVTPAFVMRQDVYENLPLSQLEAHFEEITNSAYSVSLFTEWKNAGFNQVWRKSRMDDNANGEMSDAMPAEWFEATLATRPLHPIPDVLAENCTEQRGVVGAWHERLPHFRMEFTPSCGEELQTEYLVPRQHALEALRAIYELREQIAPLLLISEVRTIAADNLWMSPCYHQPCVAIHFTWKLNWPAVRELLPYIEASLAPFQSRPHWGKLFTMRGEDLQTIYPRLPDFQRLCRASDPQGKFRNAFLDKNLFAV